MLTHQRRQVAATMRRLYERNLTTASGGNISARTSADRILLTASKFDKAELSASQICILTLDNRNLTPDLTPSIEANMHLEIYRRYPGIQAVVHAHPVTASAFCASGTPVNCRFTAEAYAIIGEPVYAPYARMGTTELAKYVAEAVATGCCVLMENHGILATGDNLAQAVDRLEILEIAAQTTLILQQLQDSRELTPVQLAQLDAMMGRLSSNSSRVTITDVGQMQSKGHKKHGRRD
ncbi:MAG: class II aldolase/adducin family protein [Candidatus Pacebacteria bacterium]|nr:class II aldolase/adducin family protein [Candidatus Paceibacterota bacterium]